MKLNRLFLAALLMAAALTSALPASAQNGTLTPYSRYGYGMLNDHATSMQRGMGGVGYAMSSGRQINVKNPASYAMIDSLTFLFDMGADFTRMWSKEVVNGQKNSGRTLAGGLDYVTMSFPLWKHLGASIGLLPYSSVGYSFGSQVEHGSLTRTGSGSFNEFYGGLAYSPVKGLSAGVNVAYLFGTVVNDTYAYATGGTSALYEHRLSLSDWRMDIGLQYAFNIAGRNRVGMGLVYSPAKKLHGESKTLHYNVDSEKTPEENTQKLGGNYSLAESWGAGLSYCWNERVTAEVDFTYQPWSKAKYLDFDEEGSFIQLENRWKVNGGLQFQLNPRGTYVERMQFRAGGYYNHDYMKFGTDHLVEYGATVGVGVPVPGFKSMFNVSVEWKHRQARPQMLVREDYMFVTLGINFNEMWFRKYMIH